MATFGKFAYASVTPMSMTAGYAGSTQRLPRKKRALYAFRLTSSASAPRVKARKRWTAEARHRRAPGSTRPLRVYLSGRDCSGSRWPAMVLATLRAVNASRLSETNSAATDAENVTQ
jgi:hypothetical protein